MRVLITGSSGFIGRNLIEHLIQNQVPVEGLDTEILPDKEYPQRQYTLGSRDKELSEYIKRFDVIIHLAADTQVITAYPEMLLHNNVHGTAELLDACRVAGTVKQIIIMSDDRVGSSLEHGSFSEKGMPFNCDSVYAASKGSQELLCQSYATLHCLPIVIVRTTNVFGVNQKNNKFIPSVIRDALTDHPIRLPGFGTHTRQWVPVKYVCTFLNELAVTQIVPPGTVLHVSGSQEIYDGALVLCILNYLGKPSSLISFLVEDQGLPRRSSLVRTDETDRFMMGNRYDDRCFFSDLQETVLWYQKQFQIKGV